MLRNPKRALALLIGLATVLGSTFPGCSPIPQFDRVTAADTYAIGVDAAAREDYLLAIEAFKHVTMESPLHELADDALLGLADAHRAIGDYASAEAEYRRLLSDYPRSELVPEAEYKLGLSYVEQALPAALDQGMTEQAITQLDEFVSAYPASPFVPDARERMAELRSRLAEKKYRGAMLYLELGDPQAARIYLEAVASEYPATAWARRALLEEARIFVSEGATARAVEVYGRLIELHPGSKEAAVGEAELRAIGG